MIIIWSANINVYLFIKWFLLKEEKRKNCEHKTNQDKEANFFKQVQLKLLPFQLLKPTESNPRFSKGVELLIWFKRIVKGR